ncbi:VTT domain-containing protein [Dehalogenimonas sp. THU2]|uniref:YqaA family protein n=1 Tax=Dehalogenimonas sp. THU2 TaxID=3151121 RepID=UPI0032184B4D
MVNNPTPNGQPPNSDEHIVPTGGWVQRRFLPILSIVFVIAIVAAVLYIYNANPDLVESLKEYGYVGAFVISAILNATVVLPAGNFLVLAALGATLPSPTLVGLAAALGAAVGEMTGYLAGYSGRAVVPQHHKWYIRVHHWLDRFGVWAIFGLSAAPLMFDVAGITAGVMRFPARKFFIACFLGRSVLYIVLAWAGALGWQQVIDWLAA